MVLLLVLAVIVGRQEVTSPSHKETVADESFTVTTVVRTISLAGQDGRTVFELLAASYDIEYQQSDLGVFVTKIDGVGGDPDTYWLYYVNGEAAMLAPDKFISKNGQKIEWRYERF